MTDLYKTPDSDLEVNSSNGDLRAFKRFSAWGVFFLGMITMGIYPMYWLYSRTKILNTLTDDGIAGIVVNISLTAYVINMVTAYGPYLFPVGEWMTIVNLIATLVLLVFMLVWVFSFKSAIVQIARANGASDFKASGVLTFFGQSIYLQYKINQYIDSKLP